MNWEDYAYCKGLPGEWFFENYLESEENAKIMDAECAICPVREFCLKAGEATKSTGLWGGYYLVDGKIDRNKNRHKRSDAIL